MNTELEAVTPIGEQGEWRLSAPMVNRAIADGIRGGASITAIDVSYPEGRKHYGQVVVFESPELAVQIVRDHSALDVAIPALKGVAIMLNTELARYESEPWAQRVRAALALVDGPQQETSDE